jgi:hypothetical protein
MQTMKFHHNSSEDALIAVSMVMIIKVSKHTQYFLKDLNMKHESSDK